jgi:hypothetical protein
MKNNLEYLATLAIFVTIGSVFGVEVPAPDFTKGDKIVVQFLGGWDDCSKASTPSWQIKEVKLAVSSPPTAVTFEGAAKVTRQGVATSFSYQWQRNDGAGFVDIANATGTSYRFFPTTPSDISASYRLLAGVPGKLAPSTAVRVTARASNSRPRWKSSNHGPPRMTGSVVAGSVMRVLPGTVRQSDVDIR